MDWPLAISRNCDALRRILAALFAMAGAAAAAFTSPGVPGEAGRAADRRGAVMLPRHIYAAILLILRPAESAVRRLIVIAARGLSLAPRAPRPLPAGLAGFGAAGGSKTPAFCLFDPLKHFSINDFDNNALTPIGFACLSDDEFRSPQFSLTDVPVDAGQLLTRLRALRHALNDISRQARRLSRWQARRDLLLKASAPFKPMRLSPFRPGLPPGWRQRRIHEIDDVLRECHGLALDRLNAPNTS
ncbi:MAG: hypothetical protein WCC66_06515 [Rhizobiaceae bacterium]